MKNFRYKVQTLSFIAVVALVYGLGFNVEAYCPFGAVESAYTWFKEGRLICSLGSGNFFALAAVLLLTLLLGRVFCGYLCPLGAVGTFLRIFAGEFNFKQLNPSPRTDRLLRLLKYVVLLAILFFTATTIDMIMRKVSPCYLLVSVNNDIAVTGYIAGFIFLVSSFLVSMPFCRWLCPFGGILNLFARFSLSKIRRDTGNCIDCAKCSRSCPMNIDVARNVVVGSGECIACLECINSCPVGQGREPLAWHFLGRKVRKPESVIALALITAIAAVLLAAYTIDIPTYVYSRDMDRPADTARAELEVRGLSCAGSAQLFIFYMNREDILSLPGYLRFAARPREGWIKVTVEYDPLQTDQENIIAALTEAYYDNNDQRWRPSPFEIKGADIFASP